MLQAPFTVAGFCPTWLSSAANRLAHPITATKNKFLAHAIGFDEKLFHVAYKKHQLALAPRPDSSFTKSKTLNLDKDVTGEEVLAYLKAATDQYLHANKIDPHKRFSNPYDPDNFTESSVLSFFKKRSLFRRIKNLNLNSLSPSEVLNLTIDLYTLKHHHALSKKGLGSTLLARIINKDEDAYQEWYRDAVLNHLGNLAWSISLYKALQEIHVLDPNLHFFKELKKDKLTKLVFSLPKSAFTNIYFTLPLFSLLYLPKIDYFSGSPFIKEIAKSDGAENLEIIKLGPDHPLFDALDSPELSSPGLARPLLAATYNTTRKLYIAIALPQLIFLAVNFVYPVTWEPIVQLNRNIDSFAVHITPPGRNLFSDLVYMAGYDVAEMLDPLDEVFQEMGQEYSQRGHLYQKDKAIYQPTTIYYYFKGKDGQQIPIQRSQIGQLNLPASQKNVLPQEVP